MSAPASPLPDASRSPCRICARDRAHRDASVVTTTLWLTISRAATRRSLLFTTFACTTIFWPGSNPLTELVAAMVRTGMRI